MIQESLALNRDELAAWLRLGALEKVGRRTAWRALRHFGLPERLFAQRDVTLRKFFGEAFAAAVRTGPDPQVEQAAEAALEWARGSGRHIVTLADPAYPSSLCAAADPPLLLYVEGDLNLLARPAIAIVGSRRPSAQGRENARFFSTALARAGWTIVSGLASGIDAEAHQAALEELDGAGTIAVIGTGIDLVYPRQHKQLSAAIGRHGALVSEWPLGTPARPANFPQRNRLIAALSQGVLIVEATVRSGSLITARLANDMGREILALPGSIHSPLARGCHALIKEGAKLVESVEDVLCELPEPSWRAGRKSRATAVSREADASPPPPDAEALLVVLGHDPVTLDVLQKRSGLDSAALAAALMRLEINGWIAVQGGRYQRVARHVDAPRKQT